MGQRTLKALKHAVKFSISTLPGTGVDTLVLWLMSTYWLDGGHFKEYVLSPIISFECAVFVNYILAFFWVWRSRIPKRSPGEFVSHFWKYNTSCLAAFCVKMLILNVIAAAFKLPAFVCNLLALCISGVINFTLNEFVIFAKKKELSKDKASKPQQEAQGSPLSNQ